MYYTTFFGTLCASPRLGKKSALLFTFFFLLAINLFGASAFWPSLSDGTDVLRDFIRSEERSLQETYRNHRFVALPAPSLLSSDPNQLRIQDLRDIECYAQPDALQVCGSGDTIPFMLFTKSVVPLQDIRLDVVFDDGIEYAGFAFVDNSLSNTDAQLDTISVDNPEAPSFLIDEVSEPSGGVVIYLGVRAECGVNFALNNPDITLNYSYTDANGVLCSGSVVFEDYGENVLTPRVIITNTPAAVDLGSANNTNACQNIDVSQGTLNASATGYIFTANNYGFEDGITISQVSLAGVPLDPADYTIDPATGQLTLVVTDPTANGSLDFNETETIRICYTYTACIPDVDYSPLYTVVSACEGVFCTGPVNERTAGLLRSNFPVTPTLQVALEEVQSPNIATQAPYVFDVVINTTGTNPVVDQLESIFFNLRRCKNPGLSLEKIELASMDGSTIYGVFDELVYSVRAEDQVNSSGVPNLNRAGTVIVDLRKNNTVSGVPGDGLLDTDGDGFFDDLPGDHSARIRFTFAVVCTSEELACNAGPNVSGGNLAGPDCQFNQIQVQARIRCNTANLNQTRNFNNLQNFDSESSSSFTNDVTVNIGSSTYNGYDFGDIGIASGTSTVISSTQNLNFEYILGANDLFTCDPPGNTTFQMVVNGPELLLEDMEFSNVTFDGGPPLTVGSDYMVTRPMAGELLFTINAGSAATGTPFNYNFDITLDTAICLPKQILFVDAYIITDCGSCSPVRTCSSTAFTVDPDSTLCECTYEIEAITRRVNTDFTDNTRTTEFDPANIPLADSRRFVSGDTLEVIYELRIRPGADNNELNTSNQRLAFDLLVRPDDNTSRVDEFQARLDYHSARVQSFTLNRRDGTMIDIGAGYSGPINLSSTSGIQLGEPGNITPNYGRGEPLMPGFPNGGYYVATGNVLGDEADGHILRVSLFDMPGTENTLTPFFDLIGGSFRGEDTLRVVWHVVLVDNPGWDGVSLTTHQIEPNIAVGTYVGDPANNQTVRNEDGLCDDINAVFEYASPVVTGVSRIEYADECEATMVVKFGISGIDNNWFTDEYRLVAGLEEFGIDIPEPFYYVGGATFETAGILPTSVEPTSSRNVDTVNVGGQQILYPQGIGTLTFTDAELADGVRPASYQGYGGPNPALNDVTTVGGTYPLIGFMGGSGVADSLVFRIPLIRACSDEASNGGSLALDFDASNRYLPDFLLEPYGINNGYWVSRVSDNDGNPVTPEGSFYFPFTRLGGNNVNRERQLNNISPVLEIGTRPMAIVSSAVVGQMSLTDGAGNETNTYSLCPASGEILAPGALLVEVSTSVNLVSITGAASTFSLISATDTSRTYAVAIPEGTTPDGCFEITLTTDLLFCDAGAVCLTPILGCPANQIDFEQQVAVYQALMLECAPPVCYEYEAGSAVVDISFDLPVQSDLCSSQTYGFVFTNNGTGPLSDLAPVINIPAGLDVDFSSFIVTLVGNGPGTLSAPTPVPAENTIFGNGYVFDQTEISAYLSPDQFEVGDILVFSFEAATSCDFIDGSPLAARLNGANACADPTETELTVSDPIRVQQPNAPLPFLEVDLLERLQVSCNGNGTEVLITTINVGKAPTGALDAVFTLPTGFSLDASQIEVLAPSGFSIDEVTETDLGGGVTSYSFAGPPNLNIGALLCLRILVSIDNVDCGVYQLSAAFTQRTAGLTCPTTGEVCELATILSESALFDVEVVPPATLGTNNVITADCGSTPGTFNVAYDLELVAPSADYSGPAQVELYRDVNGNGTYESGIDEQLGTTNNVNVSVTQGASTSLSGSFLDINLLDVCPVLIRFAVPGCPCAESVLAVDNILPTFLNDLGESVALCPGETGLLTGICTPLSYSFSPNTAGTITDNGDGTVSYSLNPGVTQALLNVDGTFGTCPVDVQIPIISPANFVFGPYEAVVCNEGGQQIDFNIPAALQEDLEILISPATGLDDPTSFEPTISNLQADQEYTVQFSLNGQCMVETTLSVTVDEAPMVALTGTTACLSGFNLMTAVTLSPASLTGEFQTMGDGTFETGARVPGATRYIPGPMDRAAGSVSFRFVSDDPEGPCGPDVARMDFTILIVDCGSFLWDGSND